MKTAVLTIFSALVLVVGIANNSNAAGVKNSDSNYTVLTDISAINKIEVRGNVEVYVSDASADQVKVYNQYYNEGALVQSQNGVLRITSYKAEKLVVWVSANDLRSISAYDNAEIKSFGKLSKIDFNVDLHDNASAKLDLDAFNASLTVKDFAKADLSGSANQFNLDSNALTTVNSSSFKVATINQNQVAASFDINTDLVGM